MNTYVKISKELNEFFSNHPFFKIIYPLDTVLAIGAPVYSLLGNFRFISRSILFDFGLPTIMYFLGIVGLLMVYSNRKDQIFSLVFFIKALDELWSCVSFLIEYHRLIVGDLISICVYVGIGYLILKQSYKNVSE